MSSTEKPNADTPRPTGRRPDEWLPGATRIAGPGARVSSCSSSASVVRPGDLFFAIDNGALDTAAEAQKAVELGAAAVVTQRRLPLEGVSQYLVADARLALAEFCQSLLGRPSQETELIGIAGAESNASACRLASAALAAAGSQPAWWDGRWVCDSLTQPNDVGSSASPQLVASWLSRSVACGGAHAVAALSPQALQQRAFAACEFAVVCLTSAARGAAPDETAQAGRHRMAALAAQLKPTGTLVANAADPDACRVAAAAPHRLLTFGLNHPADVSGEVIQRHGAGQTLLLRWESESIALETPVIGDAHATHCLAAVAIGLACDADLRAIVKGIESAPRPPGVLEPVVLGQEFHVYIDAARQADRLRDTTAAVQQATIGRLMTVVYQSADARVLSAAAARSDLVIAAAEPTAGLVDRPEFRFVDDPFAAVALGVALAEPGDSVLIAGVELDSDGRSPQGDTVRELIALRNAHTGPPSWAA